MGGHIEQEVQQLREQLHQANETMRAMTQQLASLTLASAQLAADVVVMCEANIAGDIVLVMSKVEQFTQTYKRNLKPAGSVH